MNKNQWRQGTVCSDCGISFCADHRPGNTIEHVECRLDWFGTQGLLMLEAHPPLQGCWALDSYTTPGLGRTDVGAHVAAAKGYEGHPPDLEAGRSVGRVLGKFLASLTHPTLRSTPLRTVLDFDAVVPIPSPHQQHGSGDQMQEVPAILAEEIAHATGASFLLDALVAEEDKPQVKGIDAAMKPGLLKGVFSTDITFEEGTRLLLVDDVVESQATLTEAASVLRAAGAAQVTGIAAAHAIWGAACGWADSPAA